MEYEELKTRVEKIKDRVLFKKKKPLTADVYVLLSYIERQEKHIKELTEGADRLTENANKLVELFGLPPVDAGIDMGINQLASMHMKDMDSKMRQFIIENKDLVLSEMDSVKEQVFHNFGEDSMEAMIVDAIIKKIEEL